MVVCIASEASVPMMKFEAWAGEMRLWDVFGVIITRCMEVLLSSIAGIASSLYNLQIK